MGDTEHVNAYPSTEQFETWEQHRRELGMGKSEFIIHMVEAGLKNLESVLDPDEEVERFRQLSLKLEDELDACHEERDRLETKVNQLLKEYRHTDREALRRFVGRNPGATYADAVRHVKETTEQRVTKHVDALEGEEIRSERVGNDVQYYPVADENGSDGQ